MSMTLATASLVGGLVSGAGSIADTVNNGLQAHYNRELTREENAKNREFTHQENALARDWQERMSNTAYQRTVNDLEKAGLNKMLAYGSNPANLTASSGGTNSSITASGVGGGSSLKDVGYGLIESAKLNARQQDIAVQQGKLDLDIAKFNENKSDRELRALVDNRTGFGR